MGRNAQRRVSLVPVRIVRAAQILKERLKELESTYSGAVATPTAFPEPGTFGVTQRVTLLCATPGATIHYTTDGSAPTEASPAFDPYVLPVLEAINDGDRGVTAAYEIRALAMKPGVAPSGVASFRYTIARRDRDAYISQQIAPGIHMILDYDDTKMYLLLGSERAMLIDAGLGSGNLRAFVERMIGDLPLDVVISHGHPDHIAAMGQFQDHYSVYMSRRDLPMVQGFVERMGYRIDMEQIEDLREGMRFDIGDRSFTVYDLPGHSPGSVVLFDEASGLLIAGDAVGSNRPSIPDSLWMQFPGMLPIDSYLSSLQVFRSKVGGRITQIIGGHNDLPIYGETYLDNLQAAAQRLVDQGEAILTPSLRPTDAWQVVVGDRLTDPNWAAINVAKGRCLTTQPDQIATLSNLQVQGAALAPGFAPDHFSYTAMVGANATEVAIMPTAMSGRYHSLAIDDAPAISGEPHRVALAPGDTTVAITVAAPNVRTSHTYTLVLARA